MDLLIFRPKKEPLTSANFNAYKSPCPLQTPPHLVKALLFNMLIAWIITNSTYPFRDFDSLYRFCKEPLIGSKNVGANGEFFTYESDSVESWFSRGRLL
jgi:hypothetical protein